MPRRFVRVALLIVGCLSFGPAVLAHPLDVAYVDFGLRPDQSLMLTVAVHPYQAFELVRGGSSSRFDLSILQEQGELISAYIQDHIEVTRGGAPCTWDAGPAHTPDTELDAVADGITIGGDLFCPKDATSLHVMTTIFLEGFPKQTTILRLETPLGFAERTTLNRDQVEGDIDLTPILPGGEWSAASSTTPTSNTAPRRPDAAIIEVASRLLDPGLGLLGFIGLLFAAAAIGALHALGPGHGKSLLAAVLIGERATIGRAITLASVMTATHVADVFIMALIAGIIASVLPPTTLLRVLETISAAGLLGLGLFALYRAIRNYRRAALHPNMARAEDAEHARMHALGIPHAHADRLNEKDAIPHPLLSRPVSSEPMTLIRSHPMEEFPAHAHHDHDPAHLHDDHATFRRSLWMGFMGSLAPCPTAWAMFMATLSLGRSGAGVALLVAFSIGLYATVVVIGLLLVFSKRFASKRTPPRLTYALPIVSASMISLLGLWLFVR